MLEIIAKRPEVGDGATVFYWTDSEAYTIIDISESGKVITIQRDKALLKKSGVEITNARRGKER